MQLLREYHGSDMNYEIFNFVQRKRIKRKPEVFGLCNGE